MSNSQWKLVLALAAVTRIRSLTSRVDVGYIVGYIAGASWSASIRSPLSLQNEY